MPHKSNHKAIYTVSTVSFSSDYFKEFNILICRLLKEGKAFIDFESPEMIKEKRMNRIESEFRNQSNIEVEKGYKRIFTRTVLKSLFNQANINVHKY